MVRCSMVAEWTFAPFKLCRQHASFGNNFFLIGSVLRYKAETPQNQWMGTYAEFLGL